MKRIPKKILIVAGVAVVAILIVVGNLRRGSEKAVKAQLGKVSKATITSTVRAPGRIRPEKEVQISSSIPGRVVQLLVREGDRVEEGRLLLQLDRTEYVAQVSQRRAALESARASLRLSEASFAQANSIYERKRALYERNLASAEELETASTQMNLQKAEAEAARQRVDEAKAALDIAEDYLRKTTFYAPQSGVVSELNVEEGEHVVLGTMNVPGTVIMTIADLAHMQVECDVDETDIVKVGKGQKARVYVDAFPDTVFEGTVVEMGSSGRSSSLTGDVSATDFKVKLALTPGIRNMKPGMTADGEILTATHHDALTVPIQAVVVREKKTVDKWMAKRAEGDKKAKPGKPKKTDEKDEAGGKQVEAGNADTSDVAGAPSPGDSVAAAASRADSSDVLAARRGVEEEVTGVFLVQDGKARFVEVKTGIMSETDVEIMSGLSENDQMAIGPFRVLRDLKDGQAIKEEKKDKKDKKEGEEEQEQE